MNTSPDDRVASVPIKVPLAMQQKRYNDVKDRIVRIKADIKNETEKDSPDEGKLRMYRGWLKIAEDQVKIWDEYDFGDGPNFDGRKIDPKENFKIKKHDRKAEYEAPNHRTRAFIDQVLALSGLDEDYECVRVEKQLCDYDIGMFDTWEVGIALAEKGKKEPIEPSINFEVFYKMFSRKGFNNVIEFKKSGSNLKFHPETFFWPKQSSDGAIEDGVAVKDLVEELGNSELDTRYCFYNGNKDRRAMLKQEVFKPKVPTEATLYALQNRPYRKCNWNIALINDQYDHNVHGDEFMFLVQTVNSEGVPDEPCSLFMNAFKDWVDVGYNNLFIGSDGFATLKFM